MHASGQSDDKPLLNGLGRAASPATLGESDIALGDAAGEATAIGEPSGTPSDDAHDAHSLQLKRAAACVVCAFKGRRPQAHTRYSEDQYRAHRLYHNLRHARVLNMVLLLSLSLQ